MNTFSDLRDSFQNVTKQLPIYDAVNQTIDQMLANLDRLEELIDSSETFDINQPVNQSINQSSNSNENRPIESITVVSPSQQPTSPAPNQATKQSEAQVIQSVKMAVYSMNQTINQSKAKQPKAWKHFYETNQSFGRSLRKAIQPYNLPINTSINPSINRLVSHSVNPASRTPSAPQLTNHSAHQQSNLSGNPFSPSLVNQSPVPFTTHMNSNGHSTPSRPSNQSISRSNSTIPTSSTDQLNNQSTSRRRRSPIEQGSVDFIRSLNRTVNESVVQPDAQSVDRDDQLGNHSMMSDSNENSNGHSTNASMRSSSPSTNRDFVLYGSPASASLTRPIGQVASQSTSLSGSRADRQLNSHSSRPAVRIRHQLNDRSSKRTVFSLVYQSLHSSPHPLLHPLVSWSRNHVISRSTRRSVKQSNDRFIRFNPLNVNQLLIDWLIREEFYDASINLAIDGSVDGFIDGSIDSLVERSKKLKSLSRSISEGNLEPSIRWCEAVKTAIDQSISLLNAELNKSNSQSFSQSSTVPAHQSLPRSNSDLDRMSDEDIHMSFEHMHPTVNHAAIQSAQQSADYSVRVSHQLIDRLIDLHKKRSAVQCMLFDLHKIRYWQLLTNQSTTQSSDNRSSVDSHVDQAAPQTTNQPINQYHAALTYAQTHFSSFYKPSAHPSVNQSSSPSTAHFSNQFIDQSINRSATKFADQVEKMTSLLLFYPNLPSVNYFTTYQSASQLASRSGIQLTNPLIMQSTEYMTVESIRQTTSQLLTQAAQSINQLYHSINQSAIQPVIQSLLEVADVAHGQIVEQSKEHSLNQPINRSNHSNSSSTTQSTSRPAVIVPSFRPPSGSQPVNPPINEIEFDFGRKFAYHSVLICPVTREPCDLSVTQSNNQPSALSVNQSISLSINHPVLLKCGHLIGAAAIDRIIKTGRSRKFKCPTCPKEQTVGDCMIVRFVD